MDRQTHFRQFWFAWLVTALVFAGFGLLVAWKGLPARLNEIGDAIAGPAAFLAFVWLVVTIRLQYGELVEQRKISQDMYRTTQAQTALMQESTAASLNQVKLQIAALEGERERLRQESLRFHRAMQESAARALASHAFHTMLPILCDSATFRGRIEALQEQRDRVKLLVESGAEPQRALWELSQLFRSAASSGDAARERILYELTRSRHVRDVLDVATMGILRCERAIAESRAETYDGTLDFGVQMLKRELTWLFAARDRYPDALNLFRADLAAMAEQWQGEGGEEQTGTEKAGKAR